MGARLRFRLPLRTPAHDARIGFGVGKVIPLEKRITMNAFIEPQYTVWHAGAGAPHWQNFAGMNFQFPIQKPTE